MRIGCTASRHGISDEVLRRIRTSLIERWTVAVLAHDEIRELHHGDCVGGDVQMATIAREIGRASCRERV